MKKLILPVILAIAMVVAMLTPFQQEGHANTRADIDRINRQLEQLRQDKIAAQRRAEQAKNRIQDIKVERVHTQRTLQELLARIDEAAEELDQLNQHIQTTEGELADTELQLEEAIDRVHARDQLLQARLHLIYTNGAVSYLEVLLSATSFTDFLDRYNNLKSLVGQDKDILESNKRDQILVEDKKDEIEGQLTELAGLYSNQEALISDLLVREKEAEVAIASMDEEEEGLHGITEEEQEMMLAIARKENQLVMEKNRLEVSLKDGKLLYPLPQKYRMTSDFGARVDPITGRRGAMHNGVDFGAPNGTNILAAADGVVITAGWINGYGNTVILNHGNDNNGNEVWTLYAHIRPNGIKVSQGDGVKAGQKIAEVGTTGRSTGYHLHFEVRVNEKAVDPKKYINVR